MDTRKVEVIFNDTKYFEIKCCMKEQLMTPIYHTFLDKNKVLKRSFAYYKKSQESIATTETNIIAAVKNQMK